jgi:HD-like signal output (HDOD) protein
MDLSTLEIRIARSENLPALSQVVSQVLKLADDPNVSSRMVEQVIERDAAMTAKILRVANSSFYAAGAVPSIKRAISLLGLNALRSLVISVAYQQLSAGKAYSAKFDRKQLWHHSLAVATTARILGKMKMANKSEELYGVGMMHDVGLLVLDKFAPEELDYAVTETMREPVSLQKALRRRLGYDQSDVGYILATRWNLSPVMRQALKYMFDPYESEMIETTAVIAISNHIADLAGYTNNSGTPDDGYDPELLNIIGIPEEQLGAVVAVVQAEVKRASSAFLLR